MLLFDRDLWASSNRLHEGGLCPTQLSPVFETQVNYFLFSFMSCYGNGTSHMLAKECNVDASTLKTHMIGTVEKECATFPGSSIQTQSTLILGTVLFFFLVF